MTSSPFGRTRLTSGTASAIGPAGVCAVAPLCGAGFDAAAPGFCCGAAAHAVRRPASEEAASVAASAKTKRLRLISVDFIRPSRIFTGGLPARLTHRRARAVASGTRAYPILVRSFEGDDSTQGCHNAKGEPLTRKAKGKLQK